MPHRLLISCPDRAGIVAAVSSLLARHGANITTSDQHTTDPFGGRFLMRMEFVMPSAGSGTQPDPETAARVDVLEADFREVAEQFGMDWRIAGSEPHRRVAILVSREEHCLLDLLWRRRRGDLPGEIVLVAGNHTDCEPEATRFEVPFHHVPVTVGHKPDAERRLLAILAEARVELVVLARYMQILSPSFLAEVGAPVINIHHSFLPAFSGADPYRRALERGVKIIGATAHYVTEELDAGPIIEQDTERVDHRHSVEAITEVGRDIERRVLARAVRRHLDDRVLVYGNRTVVF